MNQTFTQYLEDETNLMNEGERSFKNAPIIVGLNQETNIGDEVKLDKAGVTMPNSFLIDVNPNSMVFGTEETIIQLYASDKTETTIYVNIKKLKAAI